MPLSRMPPLGLATIVSLLVAACASASTVPGSDSGGASRIYAGLASKGKPIMIPETASAEPGGDKSAWISAMLPSLETMFPAVKALLWFEMNKETDWRIESSAGARGAFTLMANDPYFNP